MASLSSASPTGRALRRRKAAHSASSASSRRCCPMATGSGKCAGRPASRISRACSPPTRRRRRRAQTPLAHPPVDLFIAGQRLIIFLVWREPQGLLAAKTQDAERDEALIPQLVHMSLERGIEIEHNVPAPDDIELIECSIC